MEAKGIELSIPMPGHPIADQFVERTLQDVATLEKLIDEAELVFLLTDTRESRWLPTVLCAARGKPCINVALGFDTFVIIRHGVPDPSAAPDAHGQQPCNLGCYFCNDVVAPTDSTRNRILDQQCTATRPGLSAIASSIAVEIAVSIMHHPNRCLAPSDISGQVGDHSEAAGLGLLPHQIRGFLSNFSNVLVRGEAFDKCTACSGKVRHCLLCALSEATGKIHMIAVASASFRVCKGQERLFAQRLQRRRLLGGNVWTKRIPEGK
mmetsp:Transcript_4568/g.7365  ORF Transcript_4568/g.7365 Transcript_4568/m.7365 type:complete len:265 (-) Transcript_4568:213-1007(-)